MLNATKINNIISICTNCGQPGKLMMRIVIKEAKNPTSQSSYRKKHLNCRPYTEDVYSI